MHHVFISYSRLDARLVAPIVDNLRARGIPVWIDQASIPAAVPWQDEINAALHSATLVVCLTTENWTASQVCQSEYAEADRVGKLVGSLDPTGSDPGDVADWIENTLRRMPTEFHRGTEILTRVRAWLDSGRKHYLLGSPALLRGAAQALRTTGTWQVEEVREFVAASRRRNAWRFAGGIAAAITAPLAIGALILVQGIGERLDEVSEEQLRDVWHEYAIAQAASNDPYAALDTLVEDAAADGLSYDVSGFRLLSMAAAPWPAVAEDAGAPGATLSTASRAGSIARVMDDGGVEVRGPDGNLVREVSAASGVVGLAWSPDDRLLAVARPGQLDIVHVVSGRTVVTLPVAFDGPSSSVRATISGISWEDSGTIIAATIGAGTVGWDLSALIPPAIDGDVWVLSGQALGDGVALALRDGRVLLVDDAGVVLAERASAGLTSVKQLSPTDSRDEVAVIERPSGGTYSLSILDAGLAEVSSYPLPNACIPGGSTTTPTRHVVACGNGLFAVVDRVTGVVTEAWSEVSAIAIASVGERVVARDNMGTVAELDEDLAVATFIPSGACVATASLMAYLPEGDQMLVAGPGTAGTCRSHTYDIAAGVSHMMTFPWVSLPRSQALTVSPDGRTAAYGFDDGTVWIVASDGANAYERQVDRSLGAAVRTLAFSGDGATLTAVSVDGRVVTIPVSGDPLGDALATVEAALSQARALGWQEGEE